MTVTLSGTDAGSGVKELRYWVNDGSVVVAPGASASLPLNAEGVTTVTVRAVDNAGNVSAPASLVVRIDLTAPTISGASANPSVLRPPNHKMVDVTVAYEASDNFGPVTTALAVTSNEPSNGQGDGNTSPDWEVVDEHHVRLRSERSEQGSGRVYTITITATDAAGNSSSTTVTVQVPL